MKNAMGIVEVSDQNIGEYLTQIVDLYRKVFSESSWEEGLKCPDENCDFNCSYSNTPQNNCCPTCETELIGYYSLEEVEGFVRALFEKQYYQALLGINDTGKVIAFTWGWVDSLVGLNNEKLGLASTELKKLNSRLESLGLGSEEVFYYQSETGVDPDEQGSGYGKQITRGNQIILEKNQDKIGQILQRTSRQSNMFSIREKQGYEVVYDYGDSGERVLFAKSNIVGR